jgi:hypothetical protein
MRSEYLKLPDPMWVTLGVRHLQKTKRAFCTCGKYKELELQMDQIVEELIANKMNIYVEFIGEISNKRVFERKLY